MVNDLAPHLALLEQVRRLREAEGDPEHGVSDWQRLEYYLLRHYGTQGVQWNPLAGAGLWRELFGLLEVDPTPQFAYSKGIREGFVGVWYATKVPNLWVYATGVAGSFPHPFQLYYSTREAFPASQLHYAEWDYLLINRDREGIIDWQNNLYHLTEQQAVWGRNGIVCEQVFDLVQPVWRLSALNGANPLIQVQLPNENEWVDVVLPYMLPWYTWFRVKDDASGLEYGFSASLIVS